MGNRGSMQRKSSRRNLLCCRADENYRADDCGQFDFSAGALYLNEFEQLKKASISNLSGSAKFQASHLKSIKIDGRLNPSQ